MTQQARSTGGLDEAIAAAVRHHRSGRLGEAEAAYRDILDSQPGHPGVLHNLGVIAAQRGDAQVALDLFERALRTDPQHLAAQLNKAGAFQALGRMDEALAAYDRAIALGPDQPAGWTAKAELLRRLGRFEAAAEGYRQALTIQPGLYTPHRGLALTLNALGRRREAMAHFETTLALRRGAVPIEPDHASFRTISRLKLRHDIAQFRHLASGDDESSRFAALAETYESLDRDLEWPGDDAAPVPLPPSLRARIEASYNRPIHRPDAPEVRPSALNPALDTRAIARRYALNAPGVAWFDDMLTPEALRLLRRHLVESTIWFDFAHIGGFLAAYLEDGLASPLLLQISDDLRRLFPDILRGAPLTQAWAFKCVDGDKGIDVHADAAAVSVNFWITPDEANLSPGRGGLIVHRVEPPRDWRLKTYDADIGPIRQFLAAHGDEGAAVRIPYRANRCVLFKSDLFHETDRVRFRPGYENHRVNITMLFGTRAC